MYIHSMDSPSFKALCSNDRDSTKKSIMEASAVTSSSVQGTWDDLSSPLLGFNQSKKDCKEPILATFGAIRTIWSTEHAIIGQSTISMDLPEDTIIFDIDTGEKDPLHCPQIANDLFRTLQSVEEENRPQTDYMERVQKHINPQIRAVFIDRLLCSAEEKLSLAPNTVHLGINCLDRYLSGNEVDVKNLHLSGLTCLMIACKCLEVKNTIKLETFHNVARGKFSRKDFVQMEELILNYLDYNVESPTTWSFLDRFVRAAKAGKTNHPQNLESMACYLADLSLLSYAMLEFRPSMVAASCVFLAQYMLHPLKRPWNETLKHYTQYRASDLRDCILELHLFCYEMMQCSAWSPKISIKYSQLKYGCVGSTSFPTYMPYELFQDNMV